MQFLDNRVTFL